MKTRHLEILRAVSELHKEGMRRVGLLLVETKLNRNFSIRTLNRLALLGFLEGDEMVGWVLTAKGDAALERDKA